MADQKISQLSAAAALTGTELVPIVQSSATVATTASAIKTYTSSSPTFSNQITLSGNVSSGSGTPISFSSVRNLGVIQADISNATIYDTFVSTAAGATTTTLANYRAQGVTLGASATLGTQYGFRVLSNLTAATNNYAFQSDVAAATGCWNLYLSGSAQNYIRGNVGIGSGKTIPTCALDVNGLVAESTQTSISAAGTTLATATALIAARNVVTVVAPSTGVSLPNVIGADIWVFNNQATNALLVYPPSGTVNGAASHSLAANAKMMYIQITSGVWYTMS